MKTKFNILFILFAFLLVACGTSKKVAEPDTTIDAATQVDITRPPVFVKDGQLKAETNPDETISAEQWQKEQGNK